MKILKLFYVVLPFLIWSFTVTAANVPGDMQVSIVGENVKIEWSGNPGIKKYIVEVATAKDRSGQLIFSEIAKVDGITNGNRYSYIDNSKNKSGIRYYRLKYMQSQTIYQISEVKAANFLHRDNFTLNVLSVPDHQAITFEVNSKTEGKALVKITGLNTVELFEAKLDIKKGMTNQKLKIPAKLNEDTILVSFSYNGNTQHVMLKNEVLPDFMVISEE